MKFKFNKFKGFTLSELMVMLAVLTVLLAAFAPVFTARYKNASSSEIWSFVPDDDEDDAYTDQVNHAIAGQVFIGITPVSGLDVLRAIKDDTGKSLYSKVVIRPTESLSGSSDRRQKQIQFRYDNERGALFAGNNNILLGGQYLSIDNSAKDNTAFGVGALDSLSTGIQNTALGNHSLKSLTSNNYNTAIGAFSGVKYGADSNTLIGYNSFSNGNEITVIGHSANSSGTRRSYSTIVGNDSAYDIGSYNAIVGNDSANDVGSYNTVVGSNALTRSAGGYNTAIGYGACSGVTGSNKTCVGYNSGSVDRTSNIDLLGGDKERIFIGGPVYQDSASGGATGPLGGVAPLEVHNLSGTYSSTGGSSSKVRKGLGNSSVVINGNLIIRGQFFMNTLTSASAKMSHPLVAFRDKKAKHLAQHAVIFSGYDGEERNYTTRTKCRRRCRVHKYDRGRKSCMCTPGLANTWQTGVTSYDWSSNTNDKGEKVKPHECMEGPHIGLYRDRSVDKDIPGDENIINYAHTWSGESCCPKLLSDIRLKNVGTPFTAGLEEIKNLNIYNYTYKSDSTKMPHVGVVAQDLKRVFPTAVSKDENGYYQIRWDEIFYAAINAVKSLNSRVEALANRVANDQKRIATLKKDNAQLEQKINSLSAELTELEKKNK